MEVILDNYDHNLNLKVIFHSLYPLSGCLYILPILHCLEVLIQLINFDLILRIQLNLVI